MNREKRSQNHRFFENQPRPLKFWLLTRCLLYFPRRGFHKSDRLAIAHLRQTGFYTVSSWELECLNYPEFRDRKTAKSTIWRISIEISSKSSAGQGFSNRDQHLFSESDASGIEEDRIDAVLWAKELLQEDFRILDTETTGLYAAEICEIAVIDPLGEPVLNSVIKPSIVIPPEATRIHGITNEDVLAGLKHKLSPN